MFAPTKSLSLVEQKRLQWAREREEMIGLCGLWGKPQYGWNKNNDNLTSYYSKSHLLPPIPKRGEDSVKENYRPEEESETSGYLSDSPKNSRQESSLQYGYLNKKGDTLNNEDNGEDEQSKYWNERNKGDDYWAEKKLFKNYKNENWAQKNNELLAETSGMCHRSTRNYWYETPESVASDDGSRLRWGDRGIGIGHLWEPVLGQPGCRLPLVTDQYGQAPKWVEKGLKSYDGTKSEVLIISHPDEEPTDYKSEKNYLLGQSVPLPPEVIEERERKRKKALEHQNAIKRQLEERELKRKQERERRLKEEKLEEERIKKEQEIERQRFEEEQKRIKEKKEMDKKKEAVMREAIELAEKRAREEKKRNKRHLIEEGKKKSFAKKEKGSNLEKIMQSTELGLCHRRQSKKAASVGDRDSMGKQDQLEADKSLKDSASQFEEIQLANSFQLLNVNGLPVDGGLALMLDGQPNDNFLLPPDGVQLALLMSPSNATTANRLIPLSPPTSEPVYTGERTLTPSKYRINHRCRISPTNKSTQTDFKCLKPWINTASARRKKKLSSGCTTKVETLISVQKSSHLEKHNQKHFRCFAASKYRSKMDQAKMSLEDRPKWGINRPSVQYKKQSEKDPNYQRKIKEKLKIAKGTMSFEDSARSESADNGNERELNSVVQMLEMPTDSDDRSEIILQDGFRMNSDRSGPLFVPIDNARENRRVAQFEPEKFSETDKHDDRMNEAIENEKTVSASVLTHSQLEAIERLTNLREGLKSLQKDCSLSRSITPFSDKSTEI